MAVAITHRLSNGSATDAATYTTASVSVTAGDILWVVVTNASTVGTADALSGIVGTLGSTLTWHTVGSVLMNSSSRGRTTIWWASCPSTTSGTLTFQYGGVTQASCQWTMVTTTGSDTTTPVANFQTAQGATANPSLTLSPAPASTSLVLGAMHANNSSSGTAGTGYTLIGSGTAQVTPAITHSTEYDDTSPSATVAFVLAGTTNKALIAVEIQVPQSVTVNPVDTADEHTSESPALTQTHALAPVDTTDPSTSDQPALTQTHALAPVDTSNLHDTESPGLTQVHSLAPLDTANENTADSPSLGGAATLAPVDTADEHASESPSLTQTHQLVPADTVNASGADLAALSQVHALVALDTLNTHTSAAAFLSQGVIVTPDDRTSAGILRSRISESTAAETGSSHADARISTSALSPRSSN